MGRMSPRHGPPKSSNRNLLVGQCLAIVLAPTSGDGKDEGLSHRDYLGDEDGASKRRTDNSRVSRRSSIVIPDPPLHCGTEGPGPPDDPSSAFRELVKENSECYWNPCLVQSVQSLEYRGCLVPSTLLVSGSQYSLEVIRSAWERRMLRAPVGFDIQMLGDVNCVEMTIVTQTQFAPLPEALCKVVFDLTSEGSVASMDLISHRLRSSFPEMVVPEKSILYRALGTLIKERKLYHTGEGYSVVTPDTFRLLAMSPPLERQMLLTNEEAIVRLHGAAVTLSTDGDGFRTTCTQTNQREVLTTWSSAERILSPSPFVSGDQRIGKLKRSHSLRLLRGKDKDKFSRSCSFRSPRASPVANRESKSDPENQDPNKKEKINVFSKLFRLGRGDKGNSKGVKCASFSAQFPPTEWSDPHFVHFNSRATQTLERDHARSKSRSSSLSRTSGRDRHVQQNASTPVTPKTRHHQAATSCDTYRSSSLPRKTSSPSPKLELQRNHSSSSRKSSPRIPSRNHHQSHQPSHCRVPAVRKSQNRGHAEEILQFRPLNQPPQIRDVALKAGDKYFDSNNTVNVSPFCPVSVSSPIQSSQTFPENLAPRRFVTSCFSPPPWRSSIASTSNATEQKIGISGPMKLTAPVTAFPNRIFNREIASVPPSTATNPGVVRSSTELADTNSSPIVSPMKSTQVSAHTDAKKLNFGLTRRISPAKEVHVGGSLDVEISVASPPTRQGKKGLLNTDLDSDMKKDIFKIATTWNHSVFNKTSEGAKSFATGNFTHPSMTTTTNITTSVSHDHGPRQNLKTQENYPGASSPVDGISTQGVKSCSTGDCTSPTTPDTDDQTLPRSKIADAKAAFFDSQRQHLSKDDSGFSSSTSTSRPISVSPC